MVWKLTKAIFVALKQVRQTNTPTSIAAATQQAVMICFFFILLLVLWFILSVLIAGSMICLLIYQTV